MDDFNVSALHESKNEWGSRLLTILTPLIIDGYKSILDESIKLCKENGEMEKYLMTFQNLISRIPKWNSQIVETERKRICEKSGCNYLEDLVTCVHIIQLKILTAIRVGTKQKKIDINIPSLDMFIHKIYINVARKIYKNTYLFEINVPPLQIQKNHREIEIIIQECILNTLRDNIPVETILKVYMDETTEEDVKEEITEQIIEKPIIDNNKSENQTAGFTPKITNDNTNSSGNNNSLSFNDIDYVQNQNGQIESINAPKTFERLEEISQTRNQERNTLNDDDDEDNKIKISDIPIDLNSSDIHNFEELKLPDLIDDIEILA
jgi:hypothetical protein